MRLLRDLRETAKVMDRARKRMNAFERFLKANPAVARQLDETHAYEQPLREIAGHMQELEQVFNAALRDMGGR